MKPLPARIRILQALALSPLSAPQLARMLDIPHEYVSYWLTFMHMTGAVIRCGRHKIRSGGRPHAVYKLA